LHTELGVLPGFKPRVSPNQQGIKNVFLANVDPELQLDLLKHMRKPRLVGLDSMNYWINNKRNALVRVLKEVDLFVANDQEARDLSGETNLIKAAKFLRSLGPKMVLVKKGEHGVFFYSDAFKFGLPAYPIEKVIDPTGAGDTFAGGLMGYLSRAKRLNDRTIKKAIAYGTVAASFNVEDSASEKQAR
jgi:sugar/nucleoside kinase (ribokinase family)